MSRHNRRVDIGGWRRSGGEEGAEAVDEGSDRDERLEA